MPNHQSPSPAGSRGRIVFRSIVDHDRDNLHLLNDGRDPRNYATDRGHLVAGGQHHHDRSCFFQLRHSTKFTIEWMGFEQSRLETFPARKCRVRTLSFLPNSDRLAVHPFSNAGDSLNTEIRFRKLASSRSIVSQLHIVERRSEFP